MEELDRRQQILEAALAVFSTQGYHKASIKQIARAANIKSSALIYHYFDDKKALLNAVVQELSPMKDVPFLKSEQQSQLFDVPPDKLLKYAAINILSLLDNDPMCDLIRLFMSEAAQMPDVADSFVDTQESMLKFLILYFEHQVSIGNLRQHNPETAARAFIGMVLVKILATVIFTRLGDSFPEKEQYSEEIVQIFLGGLRSSQ